MLGRLGVKAQHLKVEDYKRIGTNIHETNELILKLMCMASLVMESTDLNCCPTNYLLDSPAVLGLPEGDREGL